MAYKSKVKTFFENLQKKYPLVLMLLSKCQNKWEIFPKFLAFLEKVLTWGK